MIDEKAKACGNCRYWKDYTARVYAMIEGKRSHQGNGSHELRVCNFRPPPGADNRDWLYTTEDWFCNAFTRNGV